MSSLISSRKIVAYIIVLPVRVLHKKLGAQKFLKM